VLLLTRCPACDRRGAAPCPACENDLERAPALPVPAGLDSCAALFAYEGPARALVVALKYRGAHRLARRLGASAAVLVDAGDIDVVTWAPASRAGRRRRGYDQGRLLARAVGRALRRPYRPLLRRAAGPPQTGRRAAGRRAGPRLQARRSVAGTRVLLVDDVVTTGATLSVAAGALRAAGAVAVRGLAMARTPPASRELRRAPRP
jgi:ComF family protein